LSSAAVTGDTKTSNWAAGNSSGSRASGRNVQEPESLFAFLGEARRILVSVAAMNSTSVARVGNRSWGFTTGGRESDSKDSHEGRNEESEDREHG